MDFTNKGHDSDEDNNHDYFNPEEEVGISASSKELSLPKVEIRTGEEDEELIFKMRARIYRWRSAEWKERGTGELKLLRHKLSHKIRCVLRQDKTLKPVANFVVAEDPLCLLKEHQGSDKMFFFTAFDCSEDPYQIEKFVLKFGNADNATKFRSAFNDAKEFNKSVKAGTELKYAPVVVENEDEEDNKKEVKEVTQTENTTEKVEEKTEEKVEETETK